MVRFRVAVLLCAAGTLAGGIPMPAPAADIVVDAVGDGGFVETGCRLRDAVAAANTDAVAGDCTAGDGEDRIVFDDRDSFTLGLGTLDITEGLTFDGEGTQVTIRRNPDDSDLFRILRVQGAVPLTLRNMTILNGVADDASGDGGCIQSTARVVLEDSRVSGCQALDNSSAGGGVMADEIEAVRSEISDNSAVLLGGGLQARTIVLTDSRIHGNVLTAANSVGGGARADEQITATGSTISGNSSGQIGGGAFAQVLVLRNSTVSGNAAELSGGGVVGYVVSVQNSTITDNAAGDNASGGIVAVASGEIAHSVSISNSIVWGNLGDIGTLLDPVFVAGINNIVGPVGGSVDLPADTIDCDPLLAPLADNGGRTQTHAIGSAGCAVDAASNPLAFDTDQRGFARTVGAGTDVGAFEVQQEAVFSDGFE